MAPLTEFHAPIADVTNEEHQNMAGLVQPRSWTLVAVSESGVRPGLEFYFVLSTKGA